MIDTIADVLTGDATLTGYLTGGLFLARDVQEISRQNTPAAYDANQELKPCCLLRIESITPSGPHRHGAAAYLTLWFYQRFGYASIGPARARVYALLHRQRFATGSGEGWIWEVLHANDLTEMGDQNIDAAMEMSRYQILWRRA